MTPSQQDTLDATKPMNSSPEIIGSLAFKPTFDKMLMDVKQVHRNKPHGPLNPHKIPSPWEHISVNIIRLLPESNSYNAILVIINQFLKMIILTAI